MALADCNVPRAEAFKAKANGDWPIYDDYRRILDRKDIDAVIVATGEFQRVLPCVSTPVRRARTSMPKSRSPCMSAKDQRSSKPCGGTSVCCR